MKIVVLDRDGVINKDSDEYIKSDEEFIPIEGSIDSIARLSQAGFKVTLATNQSGLARNLFDEDALSAVHHKLCSMVTDTGGKIDGIFYCPHLPGENCKCRKPETGLLQQIENKFACSLAGSFFVGDSFKDIETALRFACKPILVRTGRGRITEGKVRREQSLDIPTFDNLASAVSQILVWQNAE